MNIRYLQSVGSTIVNSLLVITSVDSSPLVYTTFSLYPLLMESSSSLIVTVVCPSFNNANTLPLNSVVGFRTITLFLIKSTNNWKFDSLISLNGTNCLFPIAFTIAFDSKEFLNSSSISDFLTALAMPSSNSNALLTSSLLAVCSRKALISVPIVVASCFISSIIPICYSLTIHSCVVCGYKVCVC